MNAVVPPGAAAEVTRRIGPWTVCCQPDDGGRLSRLAWHDFDLLTPPPAPFVVPQRDHGAYERRPVYAYDDCWPSVSSGRYPGREWTVPDHGELCWLSWQVTSTANTLSCRVESAALPVLFERTLHFQADRVTWRFRISNRGAAPLPCLHVMHPLLPLTNIRALELPAFSAVRDGRAASPRPERSPADVAAFLLGRPAGTATMLFLQGLRSGRCALERHDGLRLEIEFPVDRFPTLGIWWNHRGYPDEEGCRRDECAFEPVPGTTSDLADAMETGTALHLPAGEAFEWRCDWIVRQPNATGPA